MISLSLSEVQQQWIHVVETVKEGEEIIITEGGEEIARMVPMTMERRTVQALINEGVAKYGGGKPKGLKGIRLNGALISDTVLEDRR